MMFGATPPSGHRTTRISLRLASIALAVAALAGCSSTATVDDPMATLGSTESGPRKQVAAMEILDADPTDEQYLKLLHRTVWKPGYSVAIREAAVDRLMVYDLDGLKRTIRQYLPRMAAIQGRARLCEIIAEQGWADLSPALVSSWAQPLLAVDDMERPEYEALSALFGAENVPDVVFDMLVSSRKVSQQGLRTRCWDILHRIGQRDRLLELLASSDVPEDDLFLVDLKAGAVELGLVPHNREEILWMRKWRQPENAAFWDEAATALAQLPDARRAELEMRDVAIVVSAARHEPSLLTAAEGDMYARMEAYTRGRKRYSHGSNFNNFASNRRERLHEWRGELTWGDLAAMIILTRALEVPQVVDHFFDYADRDQADETTEYGGVIALDRQGRFEILEFPPRVRHHDQKFIASQAMLDAAYTSLFHFHMHVQRHRNEDYAGPGYGDVNYADNTRANCVVLTFVSKDALNADYYRHSRMLVDLGVIERPR